MPTLLDIAKVFSSTINDNELSAAIGASDPMSVEFSEESFNKIKEQASGLMTFDSAVNNDRVLKTLADKVDAATQTKVRNEAKALIYDQTEEKFTNLGSHFGMDLKGKRLDEQIEALKGIKVGKGDDGAYKQEIDKLHKQLKEKETEYESFVKESENKFEAFKTNAKLEDVLNSYTLADPYKEDIVKKGIHKTIMEEIKGKATLKVNGGTLEVYQKENPELKYFVNNNEAHIKDIIDPLMQPYVSKTNGKKPVVQPTLPDAKPQIEDRSARSMLKNVDEKHYV